VLKLSHGLVLTGWQACPNCNLVLNCAGSLVRLLRQKLQDGKRISFSEYAQRPLCNIRWNGWRITWGTQSERRVLHLESHSYSKSHLRPKAYCLSKIVDKKPFLVCFEALLDFPKQCHLSSSPNQVYALGHIYHWVILHRFLYSPLVIISGWDFF
jgi:hypothetical protein